MYVHRSIKTFLDKLTNITPFYFLNFYPHPRLSIGYIGCGVAFPDVLANLKLVVCSHSIRFSGSTLRTVGNSHFVAHNKIKL